MAYIKIQHIKDRNHLNQALEYIKRPDKTNEGVNIDSHCCSTNNTAEEFLATLNRARNYGNNVAHHICQSSYYKVVVFRVSLQGLICYTIGDTVDRFITSYHLMVSKRLRPQALCIVVNQLDTA